MKIYLEYVKHNGMSLGLLFDTEKKEYSTYESYYELSSNKYDIKIYVDRMTTLNRNINEIQYMGYKEV